MLEFTIFLMFLLQCASGDVLRTVYCKNQCNDYLGVPENEMPQCSTEHLKMNECGTVITCDWSEAMVDKTRPASNSTDVICCYFTRIKKKGDCDHEQRAQDIVPPIAPAEESVAPHDAAALPWLIASILLVVVALQAGYIMWTCLGRPSHQKVSHTEEYCRRPIIFARPLTEPTLLSPA